MNLSPWSARRPRTVEVVIFGTSLFLFLSFSTWNYRSHDGFLGRTVPSWQAEILAGTAPAPYVYRQGAPQLRRLAGLVLQPGHAAVGVDLFFAMVALGCGLALGGYALGPEGRWTGAFAALLATAAVYPNDKPESVAMVAFTLLAVVFAIQAHDTLAAAVCAVAAPFRPEIPILFGASFLLASAWSASEQAPNRAATTGYSIATLVGVSYLVMSRFLLWPDAKYPLDTPVLMLKQNLIQIGRYPGLVLLTIVGTVGALWCLRALHWSSSRPLTAQTVSANGERKAMLGVGLFVVFWSLATATLAKADEIRVLMPVLPVCAVLGLGRWRPGSVFLVDREAATRVEP